MFPNGELERSPHDGPGQNLPRRCPDPWAGPGNLPGSPVRVSGPDHKPCPQTCQTSGERAFFAAPHQFTHSPAHTADSAPATPPGPHGESDGETPPEKSQDRADWGGRRPDVRAGRRVAGEVPLAFRLPSAGFHATCFSPCRGLILLAEMAPRGRRLVSGIFSVVVEGERGVLGECGLASFRAEKSFSSASESSGVTPFTALKGVPLARQLCPARLARGQVLQV